MRTRMLRLSSKMEFSAEGMRALADTKCRQNDETLYERIAQYIKQRAQSGYYDLQWNCSLDMPVIAKLRAAGFEVRPGWEGHVISWHTQRK